MLQTKIETKASELLVIVGMPGSGKTTLASQLLGQEEILGYFDDYEFGPMRSVDPMWQNEDIRLIECLRNGGRWAICDTRYCDPRQRTILKRALQGIIPDLKFRFIYFENEPERCELNATRRKGSLPRHEINLIYYYSTLYRIPRSSAAIPIKIDW